MDTSAIVATLQESLFLIATLALFLSYGVIKGRQALINVILGLYFALLISLQFPYYSTLTNGSSPKTEASVMVIIFVLFTIAGTVFFTRIIPRGYEDEKAFQGFGKKLFFALMATILVMAYSFHALPLTELITPGTPIQSLFGDAKNFFYWLLMPLIALYFL